jgi:heme-degrading monooxygenase HmoA
VLVIVSECTARPDRLEEFETVYGPDGAWVELFKNSPGFVSTTLMRDVRDRLRCTIADRWTSEASYEAFQQDFSTEYQPLSHRGERVHRAEHLVGMFDFVE